MSIRYCATPLDHVNPVDLNKVAYYLDCRIFEIVAILGFETLPWTRSASLLLREIT